MKHEDLQQDVGRRQLQFANACTDFRQRAAAADEQGLKSVYAEYADQLDLCHNAHACLNAIVSAWGGEPLRGDAKQVVKGIAKALPLFDAPLAFLQQASAENLKRKVTDFKNVVRRGLRAVGLVEGAYAGLCAHCHSLGIPASDLFDVFKVRANVACDVPAEYAVQELLTSDLSTFDMVLLLERMSSLADEECAQVVLAPDARAAADQDVMDIDEALTNLRKLSSTGEATVSTLHKRVARLPFTNTYLEYHELWLSCHRGTTEELAERARVDLSFREFLLHRYTLGDYVSCPNIRAAAKLLLEPGEPEPLATTEFNQELRFRIADSQGITRALDWMMPEVQVEFGARLPAAHESLKARARHNPAIYDSVLRDIDVLKSALEAAKALREAQKAMREIESSRVSG